MKLRRSILTAVCLVGTAHLALAQQTSQARKDSLAESTITRLDKNSGYAPRRDTMKAGEHTYRERTRIVRKNGRDSVIVSERDYAYKPDPNAVSNKPVVPVSTPDGYDVRSQARQELVDRINVVVTQLDDEIGMIGNLRSSGTKAPVSNWKSRRDRLSSYRSKLTGIAQRVPNSNAGDFKRYNSQATSLMREARAAITGGNSRNM
jgi:hypothetical protein